MAPTAALPQIVTPILLPIPVKPTISAMPRKDNISFMILLKLIWFYVAILFLLKGSVRLTSALEFTILIVLNEGQT